MKIIKLSAIDSTNSFLKELAQNSDVENFTTIVTRNQLSGRGQSDKSWHSEPDKNLTFSTFTSFSNLPSEHQIALNFAVSLAIFNTLSAYNIPNLKIKWPNDILSGNKKLCGILIESTIKGKKLDAAVIGIGLNVNQLELPIHLPNASSLKKITGKDFNLEELLETILKNLKINIKLLEDQKYQNLKEEYLNFLYKKNIPTMFKDSQNVLFMGIVKGVSSDGKLQILLEDDSVKEFGIKEVSFL